MRSAAAVVLLSVAACGGASSSPRVVDVEPSSPPVAPSGASSSSSSSPPPAAACVENAEAKRACAAQGAGFRYGPRPYVYCSGVAPREGEEQAEHAAIRRSPCECIDEAALARRQDECGRVPSAAPPPNTVRPKAGGR